MLDPVPRILDRSLNRRVATLRHAASAEVRGRVDSPWASLLNLIGIWCLRIWNPGREPIMQRETPDDEDAADERASVSPCRTGPSAHGLGESEFFGGKFAPAPTAASRT